MTHTAPELCIYVGPWVGYIYSGTVLVPPPTQQAVFPFCTVSLRQPSRLTAGRQSKLSQMACFSEDMKCQLRSLTVRRYLRAQSQGSVTPSIALKRERRGKDQKLPQTIFLERTREGHPGVGQTGTLEPFQRQRWGNF